MKLMVFTVLDKAVQAYMQPFFCRTRGEAVRSFTDAVNDVKSNFNRHAADYTLMAVGEFDDQSGVFTSVEPVRIIGAVECLVDDSIMGPVEAAPPPNGRRLPM